MPKSLVLEFVSVHCLYVFDVLYILTFFTCQKVAFSKWHSKSESEYYKMDTEIYFNITHKIEMGIICI